jgi:Flp pilus assembly protein TadG
MRRDRGSGPIEMAFMTAVFVLLIGAAIVFGRMNLGNSEVEGAARGAARTISMARDPDEAVARARQDAAGAVGANTDRCENWEFGADVSAAEVTVTLRCDVRIDQAFLVPLGAVTVEKTVTEVRDQYRSDS